MIDGLSDSDLRVFSIFVGIILGGGVSTLLVFGYVANYSPPSMAWMRAVGIVIAGGVVGCLVGAAMGLAYASRRIERRGAGPR